MGIQIPLCAYFGRLSDKAGRPKLLIVSLLCSSVALTILTVNNSLLLLYVIRLMLGFSLAIFYPVSSALTADSAPPERMVRVLGLYSVFWGIPLAIGPILSGYLMDYFQSFAETFLLGAIVTLSAYPIIASISRRRHMDKEANLPSRENPRVTETPRADEFQKSILLWAFTVAAFYGIMSGVIGNIFPVYSVIIGFSKTVTGLFSTISHVMSILLFLVLGRLSERTTKLNLCILGAAFCVASVMVSLTRDFMPMAFSIAMVGLGTAIIYPTSRAAVLELSPAKRGSYIGIYDSTVMGGMSAGSLLGGAFAGYIVLEAPYYFISTTAVIVVLFLMLFARKRHKHAR